MRANKDFVRDEFIGLRVKIVSSHDPTLRGIQGDIIDETKNMLIIYVPERDKVIKVPKKNNWFLFYARDGNKYLVYGDIIVGHPWKRLTKKFPKKWRNMH